MLSGASDWLHYFPVKCLAVQLISLLIYIYHKFTGCTNKKCKLLNCVPFLIKRRFVCNRGRILRRLCSAVTGGVSGEWRVGGPSR